MKTTLPSFDRSRLLIICLFIIVLPYILLYWMMPFAGDVTLGADYQIFSINEQMELLFSIKTGSFPLYVPGYKYGHSSSALTLSQVYHPISHIASLLPGYWNGKALEWNTFLRLFSLGLVHLVMFSFLRKIKLNTLFSFLISFVTVYNLRMLEAFRYGASLEAFTGNLLLCTLIGWYFISPSKWIGPLCIIGATYLLICSGHPPMMFYGLLGAVIFMLIAPFILANILLEREININIALKFWAKVGLYICLGILLSSAYIIPFYVEFVATNVEYAHHGFHPLMGQDTITGALNNFFMPFISDILAAFGGSSIILIALLLPLLRFFRVKIPPSVWNIWGILLFALFYILGSQTPVFRWAWEYLPFVSSAGGAGRFSIIVPSLIMLLLVWITKAESFSVRLKGSSLLLAPYTILGLIAFILIPLYLLPVYLLKPPLGHFTPHFIRNIPFRIEFLSVLLGMASLTILVFYGMFQRWARILGVFLCLTIMLQVGTILKYGMFIEKKYDKPTFEQMKALKGEELNFYFRQNPGLYHAVVLTHLSWTFIEPYLGKIYTQIIPVTSQENAYKMMERERLPQQVFVEGYSFERAKKINEGTQDMKKGTVNLVYSSFNRLQFRVDSGRDAFFGLSYPYTGHWSVMVNGENKPVYRANGIAHAVEIPEGESVVEFRYWSDAYFWGMVISCAVFALIGTFVCFSYLIGSKRIISVIIILAISAGGFMRWYNSLYSGNNLDTEYTWAYSPPAERPNLAYGKKNLSYYRYNSSMLRFDGGRAVDGGTKPGSGLTLQPADEALIVDLNQIQGLEHIILYGDLKTQPELFLSKDNIQWQRVGSAISGDLRTSPIQIIFKTPKAARFIKLIAVDSQLIIDEIEAYGKKVNN